MRPPTPEGRRPRSQPPARGLAATGSGCLPADSAGTANVRVVCRLRPMSDREKRMGTVPAATASTERREVAVARKTGGGRQSRMTFRFDEVLASFSTQEEVFCATLQPLIPQVLAGYEATAFAYGQTGTGKTYTMEGQAGCEEDRGLMPRTASAVLEALAKGKYVHHQITVSYLEIYNEELTDLLAPAQNQPKLDLLEAGGNRGVCCVGLSEIAVSSLDDIIGLVCAAQERRRVAETRINARSSRSHCIFTMKVVCRRTCPGGEHESVGKLHLVDLAGSECAKKASMAFDDPSASPTVTPRASQACLQEQERERKNINQSLLTLRRVIAALREKTGRIPYRDSKLTRLLQSALGGSCRTVVIATISPALAVVEETISTLTYAEQAAGIQNRPVAASSLRLQGASGVFVDERLGELAPGAATEWHADLEMKLAYLSQEVEEAHVALMRKHQENQDIAERAEAAENALREMTDELDQTKERLATEEAESRRVAEDASQLALELVKAAAPVSNSLIDLSSTLQKLGSHDAVAAEKRIADMVNSQQSVLQAELEEVRSALDSALEELKASRAEVLELRSSQASGRAAAFESVMKFARNQCDSLGESIDRGSEKVVSRLERVQAFADSAGDSSVGAGVRAAAAGTDVRGAASQWSQEVSEKCEALNRSQTDAATSVENNVASLAVRLRNLTERSSKPDGAEDKPAVDVDRQPSPEPGKENRVQSGKLTKESGRSLADKDLDTVPSTISIRQKPHAVTSASNERKNSGQSGRGPLREVN